MKKVYLILSILGFILPNIWVMKVTIETGNIMLYGDLPMTLVQAFINDVSTAFVVDLLFVVIVFMIWSYHEARKHAIRNIGLYWVLTFLFGLAGALPLFLLARERSINTN